MARTHPSNPLKLANLKYFLGDKSHLITRTSSVNALVGKSARVFYPDGLQPLSAAGLGPVLLLGSSVLSWAYRLIHYHLLVGWFHCLCTGPGFGRSRSRIRQLQQQLVQLTRPGTSHGATSNGRRGSRAFLADRPPGPAAVLLGPSRWKKGPSVSPSLAHVFSQ